MQCLLFWNFPSVVIRWRLYLHSSELRNVILLPTNVNSQYCLITTCCPLPNVLTESWTVVCGDLARWFPERIEEVVLRFFFPRLHVSSKLIIGHQCEHCDGIALPSNNYQNSFEFTLVISLAHLLYAKGILISCSRLLLRVLLSRLAPALVSPRLGFAVSASCGPVT